MANQTKYQLRSAGFTLIETIMVIVITGILAGIVAVFITNPVQGYVDSVRRAGLTDAADVAVRRLARDIRLALPNSLRVATSSGTTYIEFIMTSAGGRYRDEADGSTSGNVLSWKSRTSKTFDILGAMPSPIAAGDYIVVFNLGPGYDPANAYQRGLTRCSSSPASPGCNIAQIAAGGISGNTITLDANPFAYEAPPLSSPNNRFQVVPGSVGAVTYACPTSIPGNLTRQWNYGFNNGTNTNQQTPPTGGTTAILASNVTCVIDYASASLGRSGLLYIKLTLSDGTSSGESVTLSQQIHVDNSP